MYVQIIINLTYTNIDLIRSTTDQDHDITLNNYLTDEYRIDTNIIKSTKVNFINKLMIYIFKLILHYCNILKRKRYASE